MKRPVLLLVAIVALLSLAPRPALGCSCMEPIDPGALLDQAGGAFVGTLVEKTNDAPDEFNAVYRFEVSQWVKSDLGPTVEVMSGMDSASCGWEQPTGEEAGILLYADGTNLTSGLCSMLDPAVLAELGKTHQPGPTAVPALLPQDLGLDPVDGAESSNASMIARITLGGLAVAGLAALTVAWRKRSAEQE